MPLLVYNNRGGQDREWLEHYDEPAWNNPVVRFFAAGDPPATERELLPRADGVWDADEIAARLVAALRAARRPVPAWLELAAEELSRAPLSSCVLAMPCFWRGESVLGSIPGVRSARAAFLEGQEVVELTYDPARLSLEDLLTLASTEGCALRAWVGPRDLAAARAQLGERARVLTDRPRPAPGSDHEHDLAGTPYAELGGDLALTPLQRLRVNARLGSGRDPRDLLTPSQRGALRQL